jgi:aspartate kinase
MITMKFGGTSVQDASAMANVAGIVLAHRAKQPLVIISAIAQATNVLEQAGKSAAMGKESEANDGLLGLFGRHYRIIDELIKDRERHQALRSALEESLAELRDLVRGVAILRELTPRTLDAFYCYGELLSSRIVAAVLQERGADAVWLDTKDFMLTDGNHNRAVPMMQSVQERLTAVAAPLFAAGKIPVTQGFIGVSPAGHRTTMGRESSDYSASIIGAALGVAEIQIWTDVDGVLTADPRVVASPRKIRSLSFEEAFELSYFGAKVLHPGTMLPALEHDIAIQIFNSRRPDGTGSRVSSAKSAAAAVKSVAYKKNMAVVNITPLKRYSQYIFWEHIYSVLTKHGAVAGMTSTSEYSASLVLDGKAPIDAIVEDLREIGTIDVHSDHAIISLVGTDIRSAPHLLNRTFSAIAATPVTMISFGASRSNLSFIVAGSAVEESIRAIHREFFETGCDEAVFEPLRPS